MLILIAVGGDGIVNEVVNRILRQPADAIKHGASHSCDAVNMRVHPLSDETPRERYYMNVADIDVRGQVAEIVNNSPKYLGECSTFSWPGYGPRYFTIETPRYRSR